VELEEFKKDAYGKSLIETISATMKNAKGGRIESIMSLLDDLLIKLIKDQKKADADWTKERARLDHRIKSLKNHIAKLKTELAKLRKALAKNEHLRDLSIANIKQYTKQRDADEHAMKVLQAKRTKDRKAYATSVKDHSAVLEAITQVIHELSKLRGSVSGIGKPSHVHAIANEQRDLAWKKKMHHSFVQIVGQEEAEAFVAMATEADQAALERLIALLNRILKNTKKSLRDDENAERQSKASFERTTANLKADIKSLNHLLTRQKAHLNHYLKRIRELKVTIGIKENLLKTKKKELKDTIEERRVKKAQYEKDKKKRASEKVVIHRIQKIVKERLANISKFLRKEVNH
jgi:hypothetical protein